VTLGFSFATPITELLIFDDGKPGRFESPPEIPRPLEGDTTCRKILQRPISLIREELMGVGYPPTKSMAYEKVRPCRKILQTSKCLSRAPDPRGVIPREI
jgi:hypothetical protein